MLRDFLPAIRGDLAALNDLNGIASRLQDEAAMTIESDLYAAGLIVIGLTRPDGTEARRIAEEALADLRKQ